MLERKRVQWRESYRRCKGARPLEDIRAEQKARKEAKERERAAKIAERAAKREAGRTARKERQREQAKAWRKANPERNKALIKAWEKRNPDKVREARRGRCRKSKARKRTYLMKLQKGRCAICGQRLGTETHIDHIMPLALGGPDRRSNLQLTHPSCNLAKSDQHPVDHARSLGRLL